MEVRMRYDLEGWLEKCSRGDGRGWENAVGRKNGESLMRLQ